MLGLYRLLINISYLFAAIGCSGRAKKGDPKCSGRLGLLGDIEPSDIWLHAASMGEVKVIGNLINQLNQYNVNLKIHLTTMTDTGYEEATKRYPDISLSYFPYDKKAVIQRTLDKIKPKLIIIAETEIWPNLVMEASTRNIPMIMVNGRMSEKGFGRYRLISKTMNRLLSKYDRFFFKSDDDFKRYQHFGVNQANSEVVGDMKFDTPVVRSEPDEIMRIRTDLGYTADDFVLVGGSTRPGEEELLLNSYRELKKERPHLRLILVPRHLERISEIGNLLESKNLSYNLYDGDDRSGEILLVNKMGLLNKLYEIADLAFVGGTLVDIGGHNILEPVWAGTPVLYGPSLSNVIESAEFIEKNQYGRKVNDAGQLLFLLRKVISKEVTFRKIEPNELNNSATKKVAAYILNKLDQR